MSRLFLIHWHGSEAATIAQKLRIDGHDVQLESSDGARAGKSIKSAPLDAIIIYLTRLPSHGRETAHALKSIKATKDIRIIFVDGEGETLEKTKARVPDAVYTTSAELPSALFSLLKGSGK
jgi:response regulator RpfG family c-di-GMP phosphodiesterase